MHVYELICYSSEDEDALVVSVRVHVRRGYVALGTVPFFLPIHNFTHVFLVAN